MKRKLTKITTNPDVLAAQRLFWERQDDSSYTMLVLALMRAMEETLFQVAKGNHFGAGQAEHIIYNTMRDLLLLRDRTSFLSPNFNFVSYVFMVFKNVIYKLKESGLLQEEVGTENATESFERVVGVDNSFVEFTRVFERSSEEEVESLRKFIVEKTRILTPQRWEVFKLRVMFDLDHRDIGLRLGITSGTSQVHYSQAIRDIKRPESLRLLRNYRHR